MSITVETRQVVTQSDGAVTAVYSVGAGAGVLFVNGWALSRRYWQLAIDSLSGDYACVTFDARGVGESRPIPPNASVTITRLAEDIAAIADTVSPATPVHLVAHSNGCLSAVRFAATHPERVASLTIINAGIFPFNSRQVSALRAFTKLTVRMRRLTATAVGRGYMVKFVTHRPVAKEYARILADDFATTEAPAALEAALSSLNRDDLAHYEADIGAMRAAGKPLLLIVGKNDRTIPPAGMRNLHDAMPGSTLVTFAPCGHFPMLEQCPAFVQTLRAHLDGTLARGGELHAP